MTRESLSGPSMRLSGCQRVYLSMQEVSRWLLQCSNALVTCSKELLLCSFSGFWLEFWSGLSHSSLSVRNASRSLVFHDPGISLWGIQVPLWESKGVPLNAGRVQRAATVLQCASNTLQRATTVFVLCNLARILARNFVRTVRNASRSIPSITTRDHKQSSGASRRLPGSHTVLPSMQEGSIMLLQCCRVLETCSEGLLLCSFVLQCHFWCEFRKSMSPKLVFHDPGISLGPQGAYLGVKGCSSRCRKGLEGCYSTPKLYTTNALQRA